MPKTLIATFGVAKNSGPLQQKRVPDGMGWAGLSTAC
jgi:hypothetical protein